MNKINANKSSSNAHQKSNKSLKKPHTNKSKDNRNKIQNKNKLRQFNKSGIFDNGTNVNSYNNTNPNLRAKSNKKYLGNKDKNKSNKNINNINSNPIKNNLHNSHKILNNISSVNQLQKKIKFDINNENINTNIINNTNPTNIKNLNTNPIIKYNKNISQFNLSNFNGNNLFKSDIKNPNFFNLKKEKETILAKTELKKISNKYDKKLDTISIPNFENLKYVSLEDTNALFTAWQNCSMIYKIFEEKIMKKNDFEINKNTLELITKNSDACKQLNDQKFWILYIEYLINNNLLISEKQFLTVINEAFSYMTYNCTQLRVYYLQKIKKYAPVLLPDGTIDDSDEAYINKLNQATINFIKRQKGVNSSNVKLKSANKGKNCKLENDNEYKEIIRENKIRSLVDNGGNI
jgi:hypothetical protein